VKTHRAKIASTIAALPPATGRDRARVLGTAGATVLLFAMLNLGNPLRRLIARGQFRTTAACLPCNFQARAVTTIPDTATSSATGSWPTAAGLERWG
jgi:hypothetical protein